MTALFETEGVQGALGMSGTGGNITIPYRAFYTESIVNKNGEVVEEYEVATLNQENQVAGFNAFLIIKWQDWKKKENAKLFFADNKRPTKDNGGKAITCGYLNHVTKTRDGRTLNTPFWSGQCLGGWLNVNRVHKAGSNASFWSNLVHRPQKKKEDGLTFEMPDNQQTQNAALSEMNQQQPTDDIPFKI